MKIQFSPDLDYQREAVDSITDLFKGQETGRTGFTVESFATESQSIFPGMEEAAGINHLGVGNRLKLSDEDLLRNLRGIQARNGLTPSEELRSLDFTVEMETGTGKTYVYLRSIFELNKKYGFTKFIIVVPSVAVKEGVYKSLQMTENHFEALYENIQYDYFVYDSQKLGEVRSFAADEYIRIMVINIDAFRKSFTDPEQESKANIIHRAQDRMTGNRPIEFIQAVNPILIIDEPQSVDTTDKSREAIASLNPMCSLRFSATHADKHHMLYKLDSIHAFERKLVKQIEVAGIELEDGHNKAYVKLLKVDNSKSPFTARIELDARRAGGDVKRIAKTVRTGHDLLDLSGGRDVYDGCIIEDIHCEKGNEYISFTSRPEILRPGEAMGDAQALEYKRLQIRRTVEEHLNKELELRPRGIKVLSLFFIDRVANYRVYDDEGNARPGIYAIIFEEEYARAAAKPKYAALFRGAHDAAETHNGYFAVDKKKDAGGRSRFKDSSGEGKAQADEGAYQLIMRDKELLLSFDSRLKFIFSHSALREGWDNPNVFQICTLNETASVMKKRQEIGRGLRIAVNQKGERVYEPGVNTLTVMANESYEDFARKLQSEIEEDEGLEFGALPRHYIKNADGKQRLKLNQAVLSGEDFKSLWDRIKYKTTFRVDFQVEQLIRKCADEINKKLVVGRARFVTRVTELNIDRSGVQTGATREQRTVSDARDYRLPDIVSFLQNETDLTRRSLTEILKRSNRLEDFKKNPQKFMEQTAAVIREQLRLFIVDGIQYKKISDDHFYDFELFSANDLHGYPGENMFKTDKSVHDHVVYESRVEEAFARKLQANEEVKLFAKLPAWFVVDTPLGKYNPDWAVLIESDGEGKRFFIVETKGSLSAAELRPGEQGKIHCAREHFKALGTDVEFATAVDYESFYAAVSAGSR